MTDQLRQAAQQALDALELSAVTVDSFGVQKATQAAIAALRTALEQQAEPPPEWPLIKNILDEYGLDAIAFVAEWKAAQQQAEPTCPECKAKVLFECVACSSNNYPPKRPWVDMTDGDWEWVADKKETSLDTFAHGAAWAADQLKERNNG